MDKKMEKLLFTYKRALIMLSKVTEEEVKNHLDCSYEDYVKGVAKKHLGMAEELEKLIGLNEEKEIDIDELIKEFQE